MNKNRRKQLAVISDKLDELKQEINSLMDDEQGYYDDMPESIQGGEKGDNSQTAIDAMQSAIDSIEESCTSLEEATQ